MDTDLSRDPELTEIFLDSFQVRANLGVFGHERGRTQPLIVTIRVWARIKPVQDDLNETLDYNVFANEAQSLGHDRHFDLVESYLDVLAAKILEDKRIEALEIRALKPEAVNGAAGAGARIFRLNR